MSESSSKIEFRRNIIEVLYDMPKEFKYHLMDEYLSTFLYRLIKRCAQEKKSIFNATVWHYVDPEGMESFCIRNLKNVFEICVVSDTPTPSSDGKDNDNFCLMISVEEDFPLVSDKDSIISFEEQGFESNIDRMLDFVMERFIVEETKYEA